MTKEEIDLKIREYWETRVDGSPLIWGVLQQACAEPDPAKAETLLRAYGLKLTNGLLQQSYDERGFRYDLPHFLINPAVKYGEKAKLAEVQVKSELVSLSFRAAGLENVKLDVKTDEGVAAIKERYRQEAGVKKNIRLFFNGKELRDGSLLGVYKVPNDVVVQVFF